MQKCGKGGGLGTLLHWLLLQNSIFFQMSAPKTPSGYRLQTGPGVSQTCAGAFFVCFLQRGCLPLAKNVCSPRSRIQWFSLLWHRRESPYLCGNAPIADFPPGVWATPPELGATNERQNCGLGIHRGLLFKLVRCD